MFPQAKWETVIPVYSRVMAEKWVSGLLLVLLLRLTQDGGNSMKEAGF
jgi:hypothetical protein